MTNSKNTTQHLLNKSIAVGLMCEVFLKIKKVEINLQSIFKGFCSSSFLQNNLNNQSIDILWDEFTSFKVQVAYNNKEIGQLNQTSNQNLTSYITIFKLSSKIQIPINLTDYTDVWLNRFKAFLKQWMDVLLAKFKELATSEVLIQQIKQHKLSKWDLRRLKKQTIKLKQ